MKAKPEIILTNAWALISVIISGPKSLKKSEGIIQKPYPRGNPKSLYGNSPWLILYAPSHERKILILYGNEENKGTHAKRTISKISIKGRRRLGGFTKFMQQINLEI